MSDETEKGTIGQGLSWTRTLLETPESQSADIYFKNRSISESVNRSIEVRWAEQVVSQIASRSFKLTCIVLCDYVKSSDDVLTYLLESRQKPYQEVHRVVNW